MNMEWLVSVIIPTYNRTELLLAAIDSVLEQTYCNTEIIRLKNSLSPSIIDSKINVFNAITIHIIDIIDPITIWCESIRNKHFIFV